MYHSILEIKNGKRPLIMNVHNSINGHSVVLYGFSTDISAGYWVTLNAGW